MTKKKSIEPRNAKSGLPSRTVTLGYVIFRMSPLGRESFECYWHSLNCWETSRCVILMV